MKFGSLDGVYGNLEDSSIRPKLREKLENGKENAYLSYDLATIRPEAPIDFEPKDAIVQPYNKAALYELFQRLEFVRLIDKYGLRGAAAEAPKAAETLKAARTPEMVEVPKVAKAPVRERTHKAVKTSEMVVMLGKMKALEPKKLKM
jgi:DNA polymerase-1